MGENLFIVIGCDYSKGINKVVGVVDSPQKVNRLQEEFPELLFQEFTLNDFEAFNHEHI